MNRIYSTLWNQALGAWVAASEHATRSRKPGSNQLNNSACALRALVCALTPRTLALSMALGLTGTSLMAADLPTNGQVVSGAGSISSSGNAMTIKQTTDKLAINWDSFNIAGGHSVTFVQPSSSAIALNRVTGSDASSILGNLNANGQVFLVNPNGILVGAGAQINVGALVASTLDISNADFEAGNFKFSANGTATGVTNQGTINAATGGAVALLGGQVSNQGVIAANQGTVTLAAGKAITLDFAGDGLLKVQIDEATRNALVENQHLIQADGGTVLLTAHAVDALLATVVNNTGVIQAQTVAEKEGKIVLLGSFDGGTVQVAGKLDASAAKGGNGGVVETSGAHVRVADGTQVTTLAATGSTGNWLINPTDFTIRTGSVAQTDSGIGATTLNSNLANTNVELETVAVATGSGNGDINVNAEVAWNTDTTLTLSAHGNININADITATGEKAGLVLNHGGYKPASGETAATAATSGSNYHIANGAAVTLSGSTASLSINGQTYTLIDTMDELDKIDSTGLRGHYALVQDLNASGKTHDTAVVGGTLTGTFAGLGHTVNNLEIEIKNTSSNIGLFSQVGSSGILRDIGVVGGRILVTNTTAKMLGDENRHFGGLVGNNQGSITNAYTTINMETKNARSVGGLAGTNTGSISNSYSTSTVNGRDDVGGLVGGNQDAGTITDSYASGAVSGADVGGLVGFNSGTITGSYASGAVTLDTSKQTTAVAGGLAGLNTIDGTSKGKIVNSFFATTEPDSVSVSDSGSVSVSKGKQINTELELYGKSTKYGLVDGVEGSASSATISKGYTWAELATGTPFKDAGWDISSEAGDGTTWRIYDGHTLPLLRSFMKAVEISPDHVITYNGQTEGSLKNSAYGTDGSKLDAAHLLGTYDYKTSSANVGLYEEKNKGSTPDLTVTKDLYSDQQGYDISNAKSSDADNNTVTIEKAALTITVDGSGGYHTSGLVDGDSVSDVTLSTAGGITRASNAIGVGLDNYNISYVSFNPVPEVRTDPRYLTAVSVRNNGGTADAAASTSDTAHQTDSSSTADGTGSRAGLPSVDSASGVLLSPPVYLVESTGIRLPAGF